MVAVRSILAALLLSAPAALAWGPSALDDMMAGLVATAGGGGYSDAVMAIPLLKHYFTVLDTSSVALDGTNVASWTASVGGIVAAPTNAVQRPWWDAADYGGLGGIGFGGGQAMSLSAAIPATNALVVVVGFRATQTTIFTPLSRHDTTTGPAFALWSDSVAYFNAGVGGVYATAARFDAAGVSNRMVVSFAHFGAALMSTNNARMWVGSTMRVPVNAITQSANTSAWTRIGARQADGWTIGRINAIAVFYPVADTNEAQSIIATMQGVYPL